MDESELTGRIIGCAMRVHSGPGAGPSGKTPTGLSDPRPKVSGLETKTEVPLPVIYGGVRLDAGYALTSRSRTPLFWNSKPSRNSLRSTRRN